MSQINNPNTTLAGIAAILTGVAQIFSAIVHNKPLGGDELNALASIIAGVGLLRAKDGGV